MKLLTLIATASLAASCTHTKYSESSSSIFLFNFNDKVTTSNQCSSAKNFINKCGLSGFVVAYDDRKTHCYPQPQYLVQMATPQGEVVYKYCANELRLVP